MKIVQKYGGRPDRLDLDAARNAGVAVAVMPLRGCIAVAELAMTLILALSKQLIEAHRATATGAYRDLGLEPAPSSQRVFAFQWMKLPHLQEVRGKTLGLIGFGEIGTEVARRARAFEMNVLYSKREPLPAAIEEMLGVRAAPLDDLLRSSDFVSLHVPHGPETDRLIGARELALMKPTASIINTCRGPVIDEEALIAALHDGTIASAGLDVFTFEPLQFDSPAHPARQRHLDPAYRRRHRWRTGEADARRPRQRRSLCPWRAAATPACLACRRSDMPRPSLSSRSEVLSSASPL